MPLPNQLGVESRRCRVLIVDDYQDLRTLIYERLARSGYVCETVASGDAALEIVVSYQPDVVIFEWRLSDGSGIGLANQLRNWAQQQGRTLHIFVYSTQPEPEGFCARELVDAYFSKLTHVDDLLVALELYLCSADRGQILS
jgi:DNA-binding response OmpR family regulator